MAEVDALTRQVEELRVELNNLRIAAGARASRPQSKDVSLVAGIREWNGDSKGKSVHEFFSQIETLAKVSYWTDQDKALIAKAKLQGLALQYLNGREELGRDTCSYETLKQALIERFSEKLPDQYYYTRLQDAAQGKDESAEDFSDRCRKLWQKTIRRVHDEAAQRIINEEAERRLVAAYINGLRGVVGQQVKYQMPATMDQAVKLAVTVESAERHKQLLEGNKRVFASRQESECHRCNQTGQYARECRQRFNSDPRVQNGNKNHNFRGRSFPCFQQNLVGRGRGTFNEQNPQGRMTSRWSVPETLRPSGLQCYFCQEIGHKKRDCPKLALPAVAPNGQGSTMRSPSSTQPPRTRK
jgi:hypothetical protein